MITRTWSALAVVAAAAVMGAACGSSGSGGAGGSGPAALGQACGSDGDCEPGLRCAAPLIAGSDRYCARPCEGADECADLAASSYLIQVPASVTPQAGDPIPNRWNTEYLGRATACAPLEGRDGAPSYCQFGCPNLAAAVVEDGLVSGCACLPGYRTNDAGDGCVADDGVQCSIFSYATPDVRRRLEDFGIAIATPSCDACNSSLAFADALDCHTGRFMCELVDAAMEGRCAEVLTIDEFLACAESQIATTCDCQCPTPDACGSGSYGGYDCACCTCTTSGTKTPRPVCQGGGQGGAGGQGGGGQGGGSGSGAGGVGVDGGVGGSGAGGAGAQGGSSGSGAGGSGAGGGGGSGAGGAGGSGAGGAGGSGAGGAGGSGAGGAGGTSGSGGSFVDECNPVTGKGCESFGQGASCDQAQDKDGHFACFPPPNDAALCDACNNTSGPFCGPGLRCLGGRCAQYCCQDFECGTGTCDLTGLEAWSVGVCKTVAGGTEPACDATLPSSGGCFVQTGTPNPPRPLYAACIASNECESGNCSRGVCSKVCGGQGGVFDTCPDPSPSEASGVTATCDVNPEVPCCRVQMTCVLACTGSSTCPTGTTCSQGLCL